MPASLNGALRTLPARVAVHGLPFEAVFEYALYTLNYVMLQVVRVF